MKSYEKVLTSHNFFGIIYISKGEICFLKKGTVIRMKLKDLERLINEAIYQDERISINSEGQTRGRYIKTLNAIVEKVVTDNLILNDYVEEVHVFDDLYHIYDSKVGGFKYVINFILNTEHDSFHRDTLKLYFVADTIFSTASNRVRVNKITLYYNSVLNDSHYWYDEESQRDVEDTIKATVLDINKKRQEQEKLEERRKNTAITKIKKFMTQHNVTTKELDKIIDLYIEYRKDL